MGLISFNPFTMQGCSLYIPTLVELQKSTHYYFKKVRKSIITQEAQEYLATTIDQNFFKQNWQEIGHSVDVLTRAVDIEFGVTVFNINKEKIYPPNINYDSPDVALTINEQLHDLEGKLEVIAQLPKPNATTYKKSSSPLAPFLIIAGAVAYIAYSNIRA